MIMKTVLRSSVYAVFVGAMSLVVAGSALAQSMDRITEADTNGDGAITWQEMLNMRSETFQRIDRNGDGVADRNDSPRIPAAKKRFDEVFSGIRAFDANGDGRITRSEMMNAPAPAFEYGDTDGDKVLSASELAGLREQAPRQR